MVFNRTGENPFDSSVPVPIELARSPDFDNMVNFHIILALEPAKALFALPMIFENWVPVFGPPHKNPLARLV